MKRLFIALIAASLFVACNNKKADETSGNSDGKKDSATITYAYNPGYSSDFSMGDAKNAKAVLDLYKMWEDGKVDDFKTVLADSVSVTFPDGNKFNDNPADSFVNFARQVRQTMASVKLQFDAWMPVHVNDKNADYVLVWYREYETDLKGKVDSTGGHAYFQMKNNKVRSWSEFEQKLVPAPMKK